MQRHRRERLVHLDDPEVGSHEAGLLERLLEREGGHRLQRRVPVGRHAEGDDLRDRVEPELLGALLAHHDDGRRTVGDLRRVARRHRAVVGERRAAGRRGLRASCRRGCPRHGRTAAGSPLRCGTSTATTSSASRPASQASSARACDRAAHASCSSRPMPSSRVDRVGALPHVPVVERAPQAVVDHRVEHRRIAQSRPPASLGQHERGVRHRFHAPGDRDLELTGPDHLIGHRDRRRPRQADLVDRDGRDLDRDARRDRRLPSGDLPLPGLQHVAHDRVLDRHPARRRPARAPPGSRSRRGRRRAARPESR